MAKNAQLDWTLSADDGAADNDVASYEIARGAAPSPTVIIGTVGGGVAQYTDASIPDGTFYWRVRSVDTSGNRSVWTADVSQTIDTDAPAPPTGLTVTIVDA